MSIQKLFFFSLIPLFPFHKVKFSEYPSQLENVPFWVRIHWGFIKDSLKSYGNQLANESFSFPSSSLWCNLLPTLWQCQFRVTLSLYSASSALCLQYAQQCKQMLTSSFAKETGHTQWCCLNSTLNSKPSGQIQLKCGRLVGWGILLRQQLGRGWSTAGSLLVWPGRSYAGDVRIGPTPAQGGEGTPGGAVGSAAAECGSHWEQLFVVELGRPKSHKATPWICAHIRNCRNCSSINCKLLLFFHWWMPNGIKSHVKSD